MAYKVFISHSTRDQRLVITLANILSKFGVDVSVAEWYLSPGQQLDKKIFEKIENSDCVIVLLTQNGIRSNWVQQEIGYALKSGKSLIPLVEKGINQKELASLQGKEYIEFDSYQPQQSLIKTSTFVKSLKLKKEQQEKALLITGGILAFLLLLSGGEKE
ncbi:MAG: toll/interleukin-1 receptor domain-containing protein [bacterium]